MGTLIEAFVAALQLLIARDPALLEILGLTIQVSGMALLLATLIGLPIGVSLGLRERFPLEDLVLPIIHTGMGLPPVVVGLAVYLVLSNRGPLGGLEWLFEPAAMVTAQVIIALPLVLGLTISAVRPIRRELRQQIDALGATRWQLSLTIVREARVGIFTALIAAFGRIIAEVGAVMLVGGNIEGSTRVLTTAIVLETRKGNFALALALGIILLALAFIVNVSLYRLDRRTSAS